MLYLDLIYHLFRLYSEVSSEKIENWSILFIILLIYYYDKSDIYYERYVFIVIKNIILSNARLHAFSPRNNLLYFII